VRLVPGIVISKPHNGAAHSAAARERRGAMGPPQATEPGYGAEPHLNMCRNIKTLANFCPPATDDEIRASALQFVRKLSGMNRPSRANDVAFNRAVDEVTEAAQRLIHSLTTSAPPRTRKLTAR
jgi:hypothetical protein